MRLEASKPFQRKKAWSFCLKSILNKLRDLTKADWRVSLIGWLIQMNSYKVNSIQAKTKTLAYPIDFHENKRVISYSNDACLKKEKNNGYLLFLSWREKEKLCSFRAMGHLQNGLEKRSKGKNLDMILTEWEVENQRKLLALLLCSFYFEIKENDFPINREFSECSLKQFFWVIVLGIMGLKVEKKEVILVCGTNSSHFTSLKPEMDSKKILSHYTSIKFICGVLWHYHIHILALLSLNH